MVFDVELVMILFCYFVIVLVIVGYIARELMRIGSL